MSDANRSTKVAAIISSIIGVAWLFDAWLRPEPPKQWFEVEEMEHPSRKVQRILFMNPKRCKEVFRMTSNQFASLLDRIHPALKSTDLLTEDVQLAIFLDWIATGKTVRSQKEYWKLSHEGILICRRQVARAILSEIFPTFVNQPGQIPRQMNAKFSYFEGAFGCIDGTHIPIIPICEQKNRWRNRKGYLSTNVMAVCDCSESLLFTLVVCGAEGCGSDSTIYKQCHSLVRWLGQGFLLGDAGYALSRRVLTPYRGVRYHLQEFGAAKERPKSKEELFNLRHAQLRNFIERCFGVLKCRFHLLNTPLDMGSYEEMWEVIYACVALHNFIRITDAGVDEEWELQALDSIDAHENEDHVPNPEELQEELYGAAAAWRNSIAQNMWNDYLAVLHARGILHP